MTLEDQKKLIDEMIAENTDATIKEFMELKAEIQGIIQAVPENISTHVEKCNENTEGLKNFGTVNDKPNVQPKYKTTKTERKYYKINHIRL